MSMSDFSQHVPLSTFLQAHPDQGSLRVQVASGGGTFPVAGARVEVYRRFVVRRRRGKVLILIPD